MEQIHYSADGQRYWVEREGCKSLFCMASRAIPGHIDERRQCKALAQGKMWINVTTADGRQYHRAIYEMQPCELSFGRSEPIADTHIRYKDYALFHRWQLASE